MLHQTSKMVRGSQRTG